MQNQIASTILDQLTRAPQGRGMGCLVAMTGAKDFVFGTYSVGFAVPGALHAIKRVNVYLRDDDTYHVVFLGRNGNTKHRALGVMAENLARVFTEKTGLYTSL